MQDGETVKCVVVGDGAVGKTCLLISYCQNRFPEEYVPTIFDNYSVQLKVKGKTVSVLLFDTAGQEDYDQIRPLSYANADVFVICFSVCSRSSLGNIAEKWIPEISEHCPNTPFIVAGTQSDLRQDPNAHNDLMLEEGEIEEYVRGLGALGYVECSALSGANVAQVFKKALLSRAGITQDSQRPPSSSFPEAPAEEAWQEPAQSKRPEQTAPIIPASPREQTGRATPQHQSFPAHSAAEQEAPRRPPPLPPRSYSSKYTPKREIYGESTLEEQYQGRQKKGFCGFFSCCR
ncbi:MAG: cell division control protein 42-like protein [Amphiamblys sp. WSBS2006]|nr:MAG: cell division control protein 42-like protein [Amphiamblys sp. WSBS2006]